MAATGLVNFVVPREYGYVFLSSAFTLAVASFHASRIGAFRRAAGIPYPHTFAPITLDNKSIATPASSSDSATDKDLLQKYYLFNCAQRAHGNFLENYTTFSLAMFMAGVRFPVTAAVMGVAWGVQRVIYAVGYTNPNKERGSGRLYGTGAVLPQLVCMVLAGYTGLAVVMGW